LKIKKLNLKNYTILGHSFGGRVIIKLFSKFNITPLNVVFIDSAGIRPKRTCKYYFKVYSYKLKRKILKLILPKKKYEEIINKIRNKNGSSDYKNLSENLSETFKKVVNEDLTKEIKSVNVKTLILWGSEDLDTPVSDAKIFEKEIKDSNLFILNGAGHYSFLDSEFAFIQILKNFLKGN